jgi:molybdopterin-guanine dinucleotide biosynthesis protein B
MKRMHIIGRKNHGKTQLMVELVEEFTSRGLRVGTIKHTHHRHELDTPGKDSHRHRMAGATVVGILARNMIATFVPLREPTTCNDRYASLAATFADCNLVLVEGDSQTGAPKIEVWRAELATKPLVEDDATILAVVTDDPLDVHAKICARANVPALADWILHHVPDSTRP